MTTCRVLSIRQMDGKPMEVKWLDFRLHGYPAPDSVTG
jgi:hypothetical protein